MKEIMNNEHNIRRDTNYITYQWEEEDVPSN